MLDKLEGRLTCGKTNQGVCIAIPVRHGPFTGLYAPLILIWLVIATIRYWSVLTEPHPNNTEFMLQMIAFGIYVLGFFFFVGWVAWTMTAETVVVLNPTEIRIERRVLGVEVAAHTYRTNQVSRLKFISPSKISTQNSVLNPNSSRIQFLMDNKPQRFAKGVTETEARALIDKMLEPYEFPGSWY